MNSRYLGHFINNLVFPENRPEDVASEIVYAIRNEKEEVILPVEFGSLINL